MNIWLLLAFVLPAVTWIAAIVCLKPQGNKGGMVSRHGNISQVRYFDNWSGLDSALAYSDVRGGPKSCDCGG
jgi:hypothetical protein